MVNIVLNVKWRNVAWVWVGLVCLVMGVWVVGQWVVGDISFRKMYGLYGLKHHIVEISQMRTDGPEAPLTIFSVTRRSRSDSRYLLTESLTDR